MIQKLAYVLMPPGVDIKKSSISSINNVNEQLHVSHHSTTFRCWHSVKAHQAAMNNVNQKK